MLPKNQRNGLRSLVKGKSCKFCHKPFSTHVAASGDGQACREALEVFRRISSDRSYPTSGARWLAYVKEVAVASNTN